MTEIEMTDVMVTSQAQSRWQSTEPKLIPRLERGPGGASRLLRALLSTATGALAGVGGGFLLYNAFLATLGERPLSRFPNAIEQAGWDDRWQGFVLRRQDTATIGNTSG